MAGVTESFCSLIWVEAIQLHAFIEAQRCDIKKEEFYWMQVVTYFLKRPLKCSYTQIHTILIFLQKHTNIGKKHADDVNIGSLWHRDYYDV